MNNLHKTVIERKIEELNKYENLKFSYEKYKDSEYVYYQQVAIEQFCEEHYSNNLSSYFDEGNDTSDFVENETAQKRLIFRLR